MGYAAATLLSLASQCAPTVAPETVLAIVRTESRGRPFALNVNGARQPAPQTNAVDAAATARRYIAAGYSVDLGLGQINSRNMRGLGLTWETVFDSCTNIAALGQIITQNYSAVKAGRDPQSALRLALSMYNTGSTSRGFRNGYVGKVVGNAGIVDGSQPDQAVTQVSSSPDIDVRDVIVAKNATHNARPIRPSPPPAWNVFERAAYDHQSKILAVTERTSL